jgi:hypothetical protein
MFQQPLKPYKGYSFEFELDWDDDVCKTYHYLILPNGNRELIDFSPYFNCSQSAFEAWIDAGKPHARSFSFDWRFRG